MALAAAGIASTSALLADTPVTPAEAQKIKAALEAESGRRPRVQPPVRRVATARLGTYQSLACVAWTRVHLVNLTTGKVLGEEED
jgi:hypothetical protein